MREAFNALKMFKLHNNVYPTENEGFKALLDNPNTRKYTNYNSDGYMGSLPTDAWGNKLIYIHDEDGVDILTDGQSRSVISFSECVK